MRSGVPRSPSRPGSSPAQRISVRTASSASARVGRRTAIGCSERPLGLEMVGTSTGIKLLYSVEPDGLMGAVERERWNLNREGLAAPRLHLVGADHDTGWRGQRGA